MNRQNNNKWILFVNKLSKWIINELTIDLKYIIIEKIDSLKISYCAEIDISFSSVFVSALDISGIISVMIIA